jgi:hypothetical protein
VWYDSPMKRLLLLVAGLALTAMVLSPNGVHTLPTITGTGAAVALSTEFQSIGAYCQIIADPSNASAVMYGDSTVTATRGLRIAAGGGYNTPTCNTCSCTPGSQYVYVANGDKVYPAFGN